MRPTKRACYHMTCCSRPNMLQPSDTCPACSRRPLSTILFNSVWFNLSSRPSPLPLRPHHSTRRKHSYRIACSSLVLQHLAIRDNSNCSGKVSLQLQHSRRSSHTRAHSFSITNMELQSQTLPWNSSATAHLWIQGMSHIQSYGPHQNMQTCPPQAD